MNNDLDEFVQCLKPENRHERKETWRAFDYDKLAKRDKLNLDNLLAEGP
ncbi:MAG: hypothetical protein ACREVP_04890 [Burkholderiales bacterium]